MKLNKTLIGGGLCLSMVIGGVIDKNITANNKIIEFDRDEVVDMMCNIDDILWWQEYDRERGETGMGSHEEGWGSNYWLTEMRNNLRTKLNIKEVKCQNCDEID